jgi:hypothetical protein
VLLVLSNEEYLKKKHSLWIIKIILFFKIFLFLKMYWNNIYFIFNISISNQTLKEI